MTTRNLSTLRSAKLVQPRPLGVSLAGLRSITAVCAALLAAGSVAKAATTWDNDSADFKWTTGTNWSPDGVLAGTEDLIFGPLAPGIIDLDGNQTANSLQFSGNGFSIGLVATGNTLSLGTGIVTVDPTFSATINAILAGGGLTKQGNRYADGDRQQYLLRPDRDQ